MPGIRGDEDEQPASSSAEGEVLLVVASKIGMRARKTYKVG